VFAVSDGQASPLRQRSSARAVASAAGGAIGRFRIDQLGATFARKSRSLAARLRLQLLASITRVLLRRHMTEEELFTFDLEGYLVVKQVLHPEEVAALRAVALQKCPAAERPVYHRAFGASAWGGPYHALIDHPSIVPYLLDLIGPKFRLDHDYCILATKGGRDQDLHGGATSKNPDHWYQYRDGVVRCGLTVVTFVLSPARAGAGGFCCIPGSHKSNFVGSVPRDVSTYRRMPHYLVQPAVEPGDAIVFTEALVHGTIPWTAEHERIAVVYKYSPGHSAWMSNFYDPNNYPGLTAQQRRILAPPSVGERPDSIGR
jgi:ectoine hydroxylase-related dioxygenase (phytanoyl-CoA dioxygenase family)